MSEQQRVFAVIVACIAIMLGWQYVVSKTQPERTQTAQPSQETTKAPETGSPATTGTAAVGVGSDAGPGGSASAGASAPAVAHVSVPETRTSFATPVIVGEVSNYGPTLTGLRLTQYREAVGTEKQVEQVSLVGPLEDSGVVGQAQLVWGALGAGVEPPLELKENRSDRLLYAGSVGSADVSVTIVPRSDAYAIDYSVKIVNRGTEAMPVGAGVRLALRQVEGDQSFGAPPQDQLFGICVVEGKIERRDVSELAESGDWKPPQPSPWVALDRQYFVVAIVPQGSTPGGGCVVHGKDGVVRVEYSLAGTSLAGGQSWESGFSVYAGPKRQEELNVVSTALPEVINYDMWNIPLGFLARPMVVLLNVFHGFTKSWGVAIMLLTLVVKLVLLPLTWKSSISMRKMQLLKPELDRLKKQFENDRERQQMEQLKLFREKGVNPLGGCLPMLLQMPVWFALYRTLWTAVDLYQQPFMWIADLTAKEPFPFLALALGALTFVQQRITPMAADNQQAKMMMYVMPIMLTVFMVALPSGLVLYIFVNSVLTILQQLAINKRQV